MSKIKRILNTVLAVGLFAIMTGGANAQYVGPGSEKMTTSVAAIWKKPVDGQHVVLSGYIVRMLGEDRYVFSDGTAEINVKVEDKVFFDQKVSEKTRIELYGEVEKELLKDLIVEIKRLSIRSR